MKLIKAISTSSGKLASLGQAPWAVADQALISLTNFVTMVLLARGMSQADFGWFTILYSILLFANSLQSGLITQPHNILGTSRHGEDYAIYTTSTAISQVALAAVASLLAAAAWLVARVEGWEEAPLLLALVPSIAAWQLQEFARRVLYTEGRTAAAFVNDIVSYGGQTLAIATLWWPGGLTAERALYAIAATSALAAALGGWQVRRSFAPRLNRSALVENWHFGKWLAGAELVGHWLSTQMFVYLAAAVLGVAAAGILRAIHTTFGPARVLIYALNTVLPIRFTRDLAIGGKAGLRAGLRTTALLVLPPLGGFCALVALWPGALLGLLYGDRYAGGATVLALYSGAMFLSYVATIVSATLLAQRRSRTVFNNRLQASLIALPVGWLLIGVLGVHGAVLGMGAMYVALVLLSWRAFLQAEPDE